VTNLIKTVCEPRLLILAWQAPDQFGVRHRWAVGEISLSGVGCVLRYFQPGAEFERFNPGRTYDELSALGYQGYPAFNPRQRVHTQGVLAAFMRRVPPRNRADFAEYRHVFRVSAEVTLSDFGLLAVTEAKLPSDGFSLVDPLDPGVPSCDLYLEVAGFRYWGSKLPYLREALGERIQLVHELGNSHDPNAVELLLRGSRIGYINRLQAPTFLSWIDDARVDASFEHLNGSDDRPRAFIFARIRAREASRAA
jgi:hypothetical protein